MGFLDNTSLTVDAILTKKGRELLARGQNEFNIAKFALSDDEIDYSLWDVTHPNGTNYYGAVIENLPMLEAFPDENQIMRYKLVTLPKETAKMAILDLPATALEFKGPGIEQLVTPNTRNGSDKTLGYTFILHDSTIANMSPATTQTNVQTGATIPFFLNEEDLKNSITVTATSVKLISRTVTIRTSSQITIVGNETGATYTMTIQVLPE